MEYENKLVLVEKLEGKVALVSMNNPPLNMNTIASLNELRETFRRLRLDGDVNAIVLTGSGIKAFNIGTDITHFGEFRHNFVGGKFRLESDLMNDIELCEKPVIAAIEGYCMGGGLEIALACDFRYFSDKTVISMPEVDLGLYAASGGVVRLTKLVGRSKAMEILCFCDRYNAQESLAMGLCDKLFAAGSVKQEAVAAAKRLAAKAPKALRATKRACREFYNRDSVDCYHRNLEMIDDVYDDDNALEGVNAFLSKRTPNFKL